MLEVLIKFYFTPGIISDARYIPVIFQVASLLAALAHPGHIVIYAPGDSLPCRRESIGYKANFVRKRSPLS
ncbi:hypothetical protein CKY04_13115 [Photorhabdus sp. S8-52]|nr:hypothetical protein CKY05_13470 [Photorhabdus sp. S10-54]RAW97691.1 hypothetical protein CKY03_12555 [Photorhabdus sp. S9-53]RAX01894.1 hypothetical protein CKY04_13115 [Photorhabdus sp. S8-52]